MTETLSITEGALQKAAENRKNMLQLMADLTERAAANQLPTPDASFQALRQRLAENSYHILIAGEAKRGKSSFINALIGDALLPTNVDISTARVFRVRHADQQNFRLRFTDGSAQTITREDLFTYGSQKALDEQGGAPGGDLAGKTLHWIEVDTPAAFLPEGVCLLDTPGTGALYAAHAEITQRFLPLADAVIFVLDSEQPVMQAELNLLDQILRVTPNIFFIQTKIDRFDPQDWQAVQQRNETILAERIAQWKENNLPDAEQRRAFQVDTHVWPLSNANLQKSLAVPLAYQNTLLNTSRYPEMINALKVFLYRVCGWNRTAAAAWQAKKYHQVGANLLMTRLTALADNGEASAKILTQLKEKKSDLQSQLMKEGQKRKKFREDLYQQAEAIRRNMVQIFSPRDRVWNDLRAAIEGASANDEFVTLQETIPSEAARIINQQWQALCFAFEDKIAAYEENLRDELETLVDYPALIGTELPRSHENMRISRWDVVKGGYRDYMVAYGLGALVINIIGGPVVIVGSIIGMVWASVRGWKSSRRDLALRTQAKLLRYLEDCIAAIRSQFLDVDVMAGQQTCRMDAYLTNRQAEVMAGIDQRILAKQTELETEIGQMEAQQQMDQAEHDQALKAARLRMTEWTGLGKRLDVEIQALNELDRAFQTAVEAPQA